MENDRENKDISARQRILEAAKKWFARKGLTGTTIRDIAKEAGLNSSLISYYFDGKEGLYRACIEQIGRSRLQITEDILKPASSHEEHQLRLRLFTENLFDIYLSDRDTGLIVIREYDRINSPAEKIFRQSFLKVFETIQSFFKNSIEKGFISAKHDPVVLASLFFGSLFSQMRLDHMREMTFNKTIKDHGERERVINCIVDLYS